MNEIRKIGGTVHQKKYVDWEIYKLLRKNGAAYIDTENKSIRTAFSNKEYDDKTRRFIEDTLE